MLVQQQSEIGTVMVDAIGRRWRKWRMLSQEQWEEAMLDCAFEIQMGRKLNEQHALVLGFELVEGFASKADAAT